jgi:hypothetical protein
MSDPGRDSEDAARPDTTPGGDLSEREAAFTRRALIQAGWTAPVILAAALPQTAAAQSGHTDTHADVHGDVGHSDVTAVTTHTDHTDIPPADTHGDIHSDTHTDAHGDIPHGDTHTDSHTDTHGDS